MDDFNLKNFLAENKLTASTKLNEETTSEFNTLLNRLKQMAKNFEISLEDIRSIEDILMSARRKGQQIAKQSQPDYQEKKKLSTQKGTETRKSFKELEQLKAMVARDTGMSDSELYALNFIARFDYLKPHMQDKVKRANNYWDKYILPDLKEKYPTMHEYDLRFYKGAYEGY